MNSNDDNPTSNAEAAAMVATLLAVAFPVGVPFAFAGWFWRRNRARTWRTAAPVLAGCGAAALLIVLFSLRWYVDGWISLAHAATRTSDGDGIVATLVHLLPLSSVVGFAGGAVARDLYIALRKKHPIHGRKTVDREAELNREHRARQGLRRKAPTIIDGQPVAGILLDGEPDPAWVSEKYVAVPDSAAHIVAIGATGAGKTQSILRLAAAHLQLGWRVIVIDAKEDHDTAKTFYDIALRSGIAEERVRIWPYSGPVDLFRGDATAIRDRLMACAGYSEPYYRAVAATTLTLVANDTPAPRTLTQVLEKMDHTALKSRWAGTENGPIAAGLKADDVQGVRYRYYDLNRQLLSIGGISEVPGDWSWEDCDAAWITLPTSTRADAAGAFGRALLVDLIGYVRDATRRDMRPILLVVEELGAIVSSDEATARLIVEAFERARSARVRTIVSVQTPEGLGGPEMQARILHSGAAVLAHRMPAPEIISEMLGTRYGLEASLGVDKEGRLLSVGSLREQSQFVLSPNVLRRLPVGQAVFIHGRHWCQVAVPRVDEPR